MRCLLRTTAESKVIKQATYQKFIITRKCSNPAEDNVLASNDKRDKPCGQTSTKKRQNTNFDRANPPNKTKTENEKKPQPCT